MKNRQEAEKLARQMLAIGKLAGRETVCILTDMEEPLGKAVGNTLEVIEAVQVLKGEEIPDVEQVVLELGAYMLQLAGKGENLENNRKQLKNNLKNGKAYQKFLELVQNQGGDISYLEQPEKFEKADYIEPVYSVKSGFIHEIHAQKIGELACHLGAGRIRKEDTINPRVGIVLEKKVAQEVKAGEILAYIHADDRKKLEETKEAFLKCVKIENNSIKEPQKILEIMNCEC